MSDTNEKISIIGAVTTPLGFFVLCVSVIEITIFGGLALKAYPESITVFLAYSGVGVLILLILVVTGIAIWRPGSLSGSSSTDDSLGFSLGTTIFHAIEGYISNLESADEQREAYQVLILSIERRADRTHQKLRKKIGEVIREASGVNPVADQKIK